MSKITKGQLLTVHYEYLGLKLLTQFYKDGGFFELL